MNFKLIDALRGKADSTVGPLRIRDAFVSNLKYRLVKEAQTATEYDRYLSLAYALWERLVENWLATQKTYHEKRAKRVYYLSLEFLMGRTLGNTLINLREWNHATQALDELGLNLEEIREIEPDAGLGNGGLGRLAACFMDSLATLEIPAYGYGIRYDYGIFRQKIVQGNQVEEPDEWLGRTNPWEVARPEYTFRVKFGGRCAKRKHADGREIWEWISDDDVLAMAYDTPIPGYGLRTVNNLRLWSAKATEEFELDYFNKGNYFAATSKKTQTESISKVLYPNDNSPEGRELRLKQQYFFVSASLQDIMRRFKRERSNLRELPDAVAMQLNDTHPSIAVAELMRILVDEEGLAWDVAWDLTQRTLAYTNHTLLPEALEKWPRGLFEKLLPRHLILIQDINAKFLKDVAAKYPGDTDRMRRMSLFEEGHDPHIRMAHLAILGSHSTNGVSALHSDLLKNSVLPDFYAMFPDRFNNKTNGITQRRWLLKANSGLAALISSKIGEGWITDLSQLSKLVKYSEDPDFLSQWRAIKRENKVRLAKVIGDELRQVVDPDSLFDVQVKRIHEYKRQLLCALHVLALYNRIKADPTVQVTPRTVMFGGKAAPGYFKAKLIIKFIGALSELINSDPDMKGKLTVLFLPNYRVSLAEKIMPASDLSEQISTAGKEASGTGNMKFALNGALTIGTLDGANIEILDEVGKDNIFIFGLKTEEVGALRNKGYNPRDYIERSPELKGVMSLISSGFLSADNPGLFAPLVDDLYNHDEYMLMADFDAYVDCQDKVSAAYRDQDQWAKMSVLNVAHMGFFSSDRTIAEYCKEIWDVHPIHID